MPEFEDPYVEDFEDSEERGGNNLEEEAVEWKKEIEERDKIIK